MIVVKIELWPGGLPVNVREIGRMTLSRKPGHPEFPRRSDYWVDVMRRGSTRQVQRSSKVENYPRKGYSVWELVRRALNAAYNK